MIRIVLLCLAALVATLGHSAPADVPANGEPLFSAKDLSGWKGLPGLWEWKEGVLHGTTFPDGRSSNTFLYSEKEYGDFELKFEVKLTGESPNSGVQFRSSILEEARCAIKGPQCDMGAVYWGSLFGEHHAEGNKHVMLKQCDWKVVGPKIKKDDFNAFTLRCVGQKVKITVNGETTVDGDFPTLPPKGKIAFQLHGGKPMTATFRAIEFSEVK